MKELAEIEQGIVENLALGSREHPILMDELTGVYGVNAKTMRMAISKLREKGVRVCSSNRGKGYWVAKNDADYKEFRRAYLNKALKRMERVKAMDGECIGQIEFEEL